MLINTTALSDLGVARSNQHLVCPPLFTKDNSDFGSVPILHPRLSSSWQNMSNSTMSNFMKQQSSPCPTYVFVHRSTYSSTNHCWCSNGNRQAVGDGAFSTDMTPNVLAVCHVQGADDLYYYSTTFSGGPGVSRPFHFIRLSFLIIHQWRF